MCGKGWWNHKIHNKFILPFKQVWYYQFHQLCYLNSESLKYNCTSIQYPEYATFWVSILCNSWTQTTSSETKTKAGLENHLPKNIWYVHEKLEIHTSFWSNSLVRNWVSFMKYHCIGPKISSLSWRLLIILQTFSWIVLYLAIDVFYWKFGGWMILIKIIVIFRIQTKGQMLSLCWNILYLKT